MLPTTIQSSHYTAPNSYIKGDFIIKDNPFGLDQNLGLVVVFSFIKQLSDATGSKMGFTIKQFTEETRIH